MALYFLMMSATYARKTGKDIFRRREVVCQHLNGVYKITKFKDDETYKKVVEELAVEGIEITEVQYQSDKVVIRSAYIWLNEKDEKRKAEYAGKRSSASGVIKYLTDDHLFTWDDLAKEKPQPEAETQTAPPVPGPKLADHQAGREVISSFNQMASNLEAMLEENEELKAENSRLLKLHEDDESYIQYMDSEYTASEERLKELKQSLRHLHSATLEQIAEEHPEFPQLYIIAQEMKANPARRQEQYNKLTSRLPKIFAWQSDTGSMVYETHFLRALSDLSREEQDQVIKQIGILSIQGPEYASLHTVKCEMRFPSSPAGCMKSRGAETLRFNWKKDGDVHLYWLYRKGDSRVRQTEA